MDTNDKSTGQIRDMVRAQAEVCAERRGRVEDKVVTISMATDANTRAIASVATSVATLTVTVTQMAATLSTQMAQLAATVASQAEINVKQQEKLGQHDTKLALLALKAGLIVGVIASLPSIIQWIIQAWNH